MSVSKKAALLAREVTTAADTQIATADGVVTLVEALVREAVTVMRAEPSTIAGHKGISVIYAK